jgi:raffinose/stachyose/melibiose transport system permease protein
VKNKRGIVIGVIAIIGTAIFFLVPFAFIFAIASMDRPQANLLQFTWPKPFVLLNNLVQVVEARDYLMIIAFINSIILTVVSVAALVIFSAMVAYIWQRRGGRLSPLVNILVLAGLIVPPAVVPTIWVLQKVGLFKTMPGLILVEIAYGLQFCILLFRAFMTTVPRELDEAAVVDGAGPVQIFFRVIFPVLRSVMMTVIILSRCSSTTTSRTRCTSFPVLKTRRFS